MVPVANWNETMPPQKPNPRNNLRPRICTGLSPRQRRCRAGVLAGATVLKMSYFFRTVGHLAVS